jgi:hypothetical protein
MRERFGIRPELFFDFADKGGLSGQQNQPMLCNLAFSAAI